MPYFRPARADGQSLPRLNCQNNVKQPLHARQAPLLLFAAAYLLVRRRLLGSIYWGMLIKVGLWERILCAIGVWCCWKICSRKSCAPTEAPTSTVRTKTLLWERILCAIVAWYGWMVYFAQELRSHSRAVAALPVFGARYLWERILCAIDFGVVGRFFRARVALPQWSGRYAAGCWGTALVMHSWRTALVVGRNIHNFHTGWPNASPH